MMNRLEIGWLVNNKQHSSYKYRRMTVRLLLRNFFITNLPSAMICVLSTVNATLTTE
jgi:hypothetical protein